MADAIQGRRLNEMNFPAEATGAEVYAEKLGESVRLKVGEPGGLGSLDEFGKSPLGQVPDEVAGYTPPSTNVATTVKAFLDSLWATGESAGAALIRFIQNGIGAVARPLQDWLRDHVSVKDFGAVGDGVTDDTAAIQACFDAVAAAPGMRRLRFPAGNYFMAGQAVLNLPNEGLCNGITIYGDGPYVSKITQAKANATGAIKVIVNGNQESICVRDLSLHSLLDPAVDIGLNNGIALHLVSSIDQADGGFGSRESLSTQVERVYIEGDGLNSSAQSACGVWATCLRVENLWYPVIRAVNVRNVNSAAASTGFWLTDCYDPRIEHCYVRGNTEKGILMGTDRTGGLPSFEGGMLLNTNIVGPLDGLFVTHGTSAPALYEPGFHVIGGHYNCQRYCLRFVYHREINVTGGYFYLRQGGAVDANLTPAAIYFEVASDAVVTGCQFLEPGYYVNNSNASVGVKLGVNTKGVLITSNAFNCGGIGVYSSATGANRLTNDNIHSMGQRTGAWATYVIKVDTTGALQDNSTVTGWVAATGAASRATFDTSTVTLVELAKRVKALQDDLTKTGQIGT